MGHIFKAFTPVFIDFLKEVKHLLILQKQNQTTK